MNRPSILHRLEIVFWTAWVAALQKAPSRRAALSWGLLIPGALMIALLSAWLLPLEPERAALDASQASAASLPLKADHNPPASGGPTARPTNGQSNLLLLVVDSLEVSAPDLHGVWLLARMPALSQVTFLPIYPSAGAKGLAFNARLEDAYRPSKGQPLPADFRQALQAQGMWWDHYLVIDEDGLAELLELSAGFDGESAELDPATAQPDPSAGDPQTALAYQSAVARQVCAHSTQWSVGSAPMVVASLFTEKALSDLDAEDLRHTLRGLRATDGIACQFPILNGR